MFYIAIIITLLILIYAYVTANNKYWQNKNVPFDKPAFFFGSLKEVMMGKKHFGVKYAEIYRNFKDSPYVGYFKLRTPSVLLRDPELIKSVLVKNFANFDRNDFEIDGSLDPLFSTNIFMQWGEKWKKNRSVWTSGLTANKLKNMFNTVTDKVDDMIDHLKEHVENNPDEPLEAKDLSSNFFIDVVVTSVFGLKINSFKLKDNPFKRIANMFFTQSFFDNLKFLFITMLPKLQKLLRISFLPKKLENELISLAKDILRIREKSGFDKSNAFDVILQAENKNKRSLEIESGGLVLNFLMDGTETSAGVSGFLLYALAANQNVQSKLREELNYHAKNNNGLITYDNINQLTYLDNILSETLRLYPPAMALLKICTRSFEFPPIKSGGKPVEIEAGTPVLIPVYGLHMDPEIFPDPEKFDPERFSDENKSGINKYAYLPFGEGPRMCIGMRMAMNQIKVGAAEIIKTFEIRLAPKMQNKPIVLEPTAFIFQATDGLWITFHKLDK